MPNFSAPPSLQKPLSTDDFFPLTPQNHPLDSLKTHILLLKSLRVRRMVVLSKFDELSQFKSAGRERDNARNRFRALFIVSDHATADAECARCGVERVGLAFAPVLECVG
jgi:hypothetical protein